MTHISYIFCCWHPQNFLKFLYGHSKTTFNTSICFRKLYVQITLTSVFIFPYRFKLLGIWSVVMLPEWVYRVINFLDWLKTVLSFSNYHLPFDWEMVWSKVLNANRCRFFECLKKLHQKLFRLFLEHFSSPIE